MNLRTPLARAKGLGSAKEGLKHWWMQRVSSLFLIPLAMWGALTMASLGDYDHQHFSSWLAKPFNAILMLAFLVSACYHAALGLQVIATDYVHSTALKITSIVAIYVFLFALVLAGVFAVIKIAF